MMKRNSIILACVLAVSVSLVSLAPPVFALDAEAGAKTAATASPAGTAPTQPQAITGSVQATVQTAPVSVSASAPAVTADPATLQATDYLEIQAKPGESKHKLQEYALALNNKQARHIQVLQLEVANGLTEQAYLQLRQQKSQAKMRMAGGVLRGLTSVATSFVPYAGLGSMAAYQAIGVGSTAASSAASLMENASGAVDYAGHIVQRASDIMISPNQQFQCRIVVPQSEQPAVKVIFKDLESNRIYDIQK